MKKPVIQAAALVFNSGAFARHDLRHLCRGCEYLSRNGTVYERV